MLFKSLFILVILVLSYSAAVLRVCDSANFTIGSKQYGYVHHYGIYENLDILEFSTTLPPANFRFKSNNALQEVESGKCVGRITNSHLQLVLTNNCDGAFLDQWVYNSNKEQLVNINIGYCFSTWYYSVPPPDVEFVPGLSPCAEWNRMILTPNPTLQDKEKLRN